MARSTITCENRTTIPPEVRQHLQVGPADILIWEVLGGTIQVAAASRDFQRHRGAVRVAPRAAAGNLERARALRGEERW